MIWLMLSCAGETIHVSTEKKELPAPAIIALEWMCDAEIDTWTFDVHANGWTANGHLWMSDGTSTEKHYIQSVGAAADGSDDHLSIELEIMADWRDAESGKSTRFRCSHEASLSFLTTIMHPETSDITDCVKSDDFDWSLIEGAPICIQEED